MPNFAAWVAVVILAAATSGLVMSLTSARVPTWTSLRSNGALAAMVAGALIGHCLLGVWPRWVPLSALDRLLTVVLPATVVFEAAVGWQCAPTIRLSRWRPRCGWQLPVRCCFAIVMVIVLLHHSVYLSAAMIPASLMVIGSIAILLIVQIASARLAIRSQQAARTLCFVYSAALLVTGLIVMMAGYVNGGSAAFPWAGALAGAALGARPGRHPSELSPVINLTVMVHFGIAFIGRFFGGLSTWSACLLVTAPLLGWALELPVFGKLPAWAREYSRFLLAAVLLILLLLLAKRRFDREMAPLLSVAGACDSTSGARSNLLPPCMRWTGAGRRAFANYPRQSQHRATRNIHRDFEVGGRASRIELDRIVLRSRSD